MNIYFCFLLICLPSVLWSNPIQTSATNVPKILCRGAGFSLYKYDLNKEFEYSYSSKTKLWIKNKSNDADSVLSLNATVLIQLIEPCRYQIRLRNVIASAPSISDSKNITDELEKNAVFFSIDSKGELFSLVQFNGETEENWVKNVKRGIISAFQMRSESELKSADPLNSNSTSEPKSSVVYETDLFGRCRTTYVFRNKGIVSEIVKKKALHTCDSDLFTESSVQGEKYISYAEYPEGHRFLENHQCEASIKYGAIEKVLCKHNSLIRSGSSVDNGLEAVSELSLTFRKTNVASKTESQEKSTLLSIVHEYDKESNQSENFVTTSFFDNVCENAKNGFLDSQYAKNFKNLINFLKTKSKSELLDLFKEGSAKCNFAGNSIISGIVNTETDHSVEAVLDLLDQDLLRDSIFTTEFPLLTSVSRIQNPSADLISKLKSYLSAKDEKFNYLHKTYLVYSTIIKTFCSKNDCSKTLDDWTSILVQNLGTDCSDSKNKEAVVHTLKSIGNIGYVNDASILEKCASQKQNSLEVRVSAIQALRRFGCSNTENVDGLYQILQDPQDDSEVRINAFKSMVRCSNTDKFQTFAAKNFGKFIFSEKDHQVVAFIVDFAKQRGLTVLLNTILANTEINDQLNESYKKLSWNSFNFGYSIKRDAAIEVDASVIYTPSTFVPRAINLNITFHGYGMRINGLGVQIRLEGVDELVKSVFIDKLTSEQLIKRFTEKPEQLIDILNLLADKLKLSSEKPYASISLQRFGSEDFFLQLDTLEKLKDFAEWTRGFWTNGEFNNIWLQQTVFKEGEFMKSLKLMSFKNKKPLINGFEFGVEADLNAAVFHSRKGKLNIKQTSFDVNLVTNNGASLFFRKHFNVRINEENQIALRKDDNSYLRLKLDFNGLRKADGSVKFNLNLDPEENIQVFFSEGKLYKLVTDSSYIEVNKARMQSKARNLCSPDFLFENVGVDVCLSVQRSIGAYKNIFKPLTSTNLFSFNTIQMMSNWNSDKIIKNILDDSEDFDFGLDSSYDDEEDDEDDEDGQKSGCSMTDPYHYEISVHNPNLINQFILTGERVRTQNKKSWEVSIDSSSRKIGVQKRLDISYSRYRNITSNSYVRGVSLDLKLPQENDVKFHVSSHVDYKKNEQFEYIFKLENKIIDSVKLNVHSLQSLKTEGKIIPNSKLHVIYQSKLFQAIGTYYQLLYNVECVEKLINTQLIVENKRHKFISSNLELNSNDEAEEYHRDYSIKFDFNTVFATEINLSGRFAYGIARSDIDITGYFDTLLLPTRIPLDINSSHKYISEPEKDVQVSFETKIPLLSIAHGGEVKFGFGEKRRFSSVKFNKLGSKDLPVIVSYETIRQENSITSFEISLKNLEIDLTRSDSRVAHFVRKSTPNDQVLHDVVVQYAFAEKPEVEELKYDFDVYVNKDAILGYKAQIIGNFSLILSNPLEVTYQKLGASLDVNIFGEKAGFNSVSKSTQSLKNNIRDVDASLALSGSLISLAGFQKLILKTTNESLDFVVERDSNELNNSKLTFGVDRELFIFKILDHLKSSKKVRRSTEDTSEFDFDFQRKLDDGTEKTQKGLIKYKLHDLFNFEVSMSVKDVFEIRATLANKKELNEFLRKARLSLSLLEAEEPSDTSLEIELNKANSEEFNLKVEGKHGKHGELNKKEDLVAFIGLKGKVKLQKLYEHGIEIKLPILFADHEFSVNHDSEKKLTNILYRHSTDSSIIGFLFESLKLTAEIDQMAHLNGNLDATYLLGSLLNEDPEKTEKKLKINLNNEKCGENCLNSNFNVEQEIRKKCSIFSMNTKFNNVTSNESSNLERSITLKCDKDLLTNTALNFNAIKNKYSEWRTETIFKSESTFYDVKRFEWSTEPLSSRNGYLRLLTELSSDNSLLASVEFDREFDESSELKSATYKIESNFGKTHLKSCNWRINNTNDYLNEIDCSLTIPSLAESRQYGYKLFIPKPKLSSTNQAFEFTLIFPTGRVLFVDYKASRALFRNANLNLTSRFYWDYAREKSRAVTVNIRREKFAPRQYRFLVELIESPLIKTSKVEALIKQAFNESIYSITGLYELKNGKNNKFELSTNFNSDSVQTSIKFGLNIQRPKLSIQYRNDFNKLNGRLNKLQIRFSDLINFVIDNQVDPHDKKISIEISNRAGGSGYKLAASSRNENDIYITRGTLRKDNKDVSSITSWFDSENTKLNVKLNGSETKSNYEFNFGLYNESTAVGSMKQNGEFVETMSIRLIPLNKAKPFGTQELVLNIKWNDFWKNLEKTILGDSSESLTNGTSYLRYVYNELRGEFKPILQSINNGRDNTLDDVKNTILYELEYIGLAPRLPEKNFPKDTKAVSLEDEEEITDEMFYKQFFESYNRIVNKLNSIREISYKSNIKLLTALIPKLSKISYNHGNSTSFENNIEIRQYIPRASNLYQLRTESRNDVRRFAAALESIQSLSLMQPIELLSLEAVNNRYKYRTVRHGYSSVGTVYNKRNIIGFGGEFESIHTQSRYLLAHDMTENRFSIILNNSSQSDILSIYLYGKGPIGISYEKVTYNNTLVSLPFEIKHENGEINIGRSNNGICVNSNNDITVCCYQESTSCSIALSKWWYGKVNGLLGNSNNYPQKLRQEDWSVNKVDFRKAVLKPSTEEAVEKCSKYFGDNSFFSNTFVSVRPGGWKKACEVAFTLNPRLDYCSLLKAFTEHARFEYGHVRLPKECYECNNPTLKKSYKTNDKIESSEDKIVQGEDYVFISLPCDNKKFSLNYDSLLQSLSSDKSKAKNFYGIKIDGDDTSIYQARNGQFVITDGKVLNSAFKSNSNNKITQLAFYKALFYAQTLFAKRVASARHLIIVSCGNCLPHNSKFITKLSKELEARNVIVSSWGDYNIKFDGEKDNVIGYNSKDYFYSTDDKNELNIGRIGASRVEHENDMCHRLALRTHGSVFNLREVRKTSVLDKLPELVQRSSQRFSFSIKSCQLVQNKKFSDFADFKFDREVNKTQSTSEFYGESEEEEEEKKAKSLSQIVNLFSSDPNNYGMEIDLGKLFKDEADFERYDDDLEEEYFKFDEILHDDEDLIYESIFDFKIPEFQIPEFKITQFKVPDFNVPEFKFDLEKISNVQLDFSENDLSSMGRKIKFDE